MSVATTIANRQSCCRTLSEPANLPLINEVRRIRLRYAYRNGFCYVRFPSFTGRHLGKSCLIPYRACAKWSKGSKTDAILCRFSKKTAPITVCRFGSRAVLYDPKTGTSRIQYGIEYATTERFCRSLGRTYIGQESPPFRQFLRAAFSKMYRPFAKPCNRKVSAVVSWPIRLRR